MMYTADFCKEQMISGLVTMIVGIVATIALFGLTITAFVMDSFYFIGFGTFAVCAMIGTSAAKDHYKEFSKELDEHIRAEEN